MITVKPILILSAAGLLFMFGSCTSKVDQMKKAAETALQQAEQAGNAVAADSVVLQQAMQRVDAFAARFKDDPSVPDMLYRLALVLQQQQKPDQAVAHLRKVHSMYPASPAAHKALFLEGFLLANELNDTAGARAAYTKFLTHFSQWDEKLTRDARFELEHLGKTPEAILEEILKQRKADSTQAPS